MVRLREEGAFGPARSAASEATERLAAGVEDWRPAEPELPSDPRALASLVLDRNRVESS